MSVFETNSLSSSSACASAAPLPTTMSGFLASLSSFDMHEGEYEGLDQMNYAKAFCKESFRIDKIEDIPGFGWFAVHSLAAASSLSIVCATASSGKSM